MTDKQLAQKVAPMPATVVRQNPMASFADPQLFDQLWRGAQALAKSQLVPQHFRGKSEDCFIGLHIAHRLGADPLLVLQNLYIVQGKAGWNSQFMIAQANAAGVFRGRMKFKVEGEGKAMAATAYATLAETGEEVSETVTMAQAQAEGWTKNKKYETLPGLMLRYRAATFLVRLNCPEVMLGMPVVDEVVDVQAAAPQEQPQRPASGTEALRAALEAPAEPESSTLVVDKETGELVYASESVQAFFEGDQNGGEETKDAGGEKGEAS